VFVHGQEPQSSSNATAQMHGRVQVPRLYHRADDHGVKNLLSCALARDSVHENQWVLAAELRAEDSEELPVPSNFPLNKEQREVSYEYRVTEATRD
jgi:Mn-containing catalase